MNAARDFKWEVGRLEADSPFFSDGDAVYLAIDNADSHIYVKLTRPDALNIGEAIIKSTMPEFTKAHIKSLTTPYTVKAEDVKDAEPQPQGGA